MVGDVFQDLLNVRSVGVHGEKFPPAVAVRQEQNLFAVGRPLRRDAARVRDGERVVARQKVLVTAVHARLRDLPGRLLLDHVDDALAVGRDCRGQDAQGIVGWRRDAQIADKGLGLGLAARGRLHQADVAVAVDDGPVGRDGRRDGAFTRAHVVERAVGDVDRAEFPLDGRGTLKTAPAETDLAAALGRALIAENDFGIVRAPNGRAGLVRLVEQAFAAAVGVNDIDAGDGTLAREGQHRAPVIPLRVHAKGHTPEIRAVAVHSVDVAAGRVHERELAADALAERRRRHQGVNVGRRGRRGEGRYTVAVHGDAHVHRRARVVIGDGIVRARLVERAVPAERVLLLRAAHAESLQPVAALPIGDLFGRVDGKKQTVGGRRVEKRRRRLFLAADVKLEPLRRVGGNSHGLPVREQSIVRTGTALRERGCGGQEEHGGKQDNQKCFFNHTNACALLLRRRNGTRQLNGTRRGRIAGLFAEHGHAVAGLEVGQRALVGFADEGGVVHLDDHDLVRRADFDGIAVHGLDLPARDAIAELGRIEPAEAAEAAAELPALPGRALRVLSGLPGLSGLGVTLTEIPVPRRETARIVCGSLSVPELPAAELPVPALRVLPRALLEKRIRRARCLRLRVGHAAEKARARRDDCEDDCADNDNW